MREKTGKLFSTARQKWLWKGIYLGFIKEIHQPDRGKA